MSFGVEIYDDDDFENVELVNAMALTREMVKMPAGLSEVLVF